VAASTSPPVGLIGLGRMGQPIGRRLLDRGVPLWVHNRTATAADPLRAAGAQWADSPKALGATVGTGVVLTLLTDARALRPVLFGRSGLARGLAPGALVVDLSTIAPDESRAVAARLATRGVGFVDAPLGGSTPAAADGQLIAFVGGSPSEVDRARPLLAAFARRVEHLGPVGAGSSMKLVNNLLTVAHVALAAEALAFAEALDLPRERVVDLLLDGGAASRMLALKRAAFVRRDYAPQFRLALAAKDLGLIARTARASGGAAPIAAEVRRCARAAIRAGRGDDDFAVLLETALARYVRAPAPGAGQAEGPRGR